MEFQQALSELRTKREELVGRIYGGASLIKREDMAAGIERGIDSAVRHVFEMYNAGFELGCGFGRTKSQGEDLRYDVFYSLIIAHIKRAEGFVVDKMETVKEDGR